MGVALTARRSVGECENGEGQNPWQTTSKGVGGKDKGRGIRHPLPLPFPFLRKSVQGRECIVRMLSTLVYICFVQGGGGWFRVILEHN